MIASAPLANEDTGESGASVGAPIPLVPGARETGPMVLIATSQFAWATPEGPQEAAPHAFVEPDQGGAQMVQETAEADPALASAPARETAPDTPQAPALVASGAEDFAAATAAFELGDCENALQSYAQALEKGGLPRRQVSTGHNNRGRCLYDHARYYEALTELNKAIGVDQAYAAAYYNRGRVHNALGNSAKARSDLKAAYDLGFGRLQPAE